MIRGLTSASPKLSSLLSQIVTVAITRAAAMDSDNSFLDRLLWKALAETSHVVLYQGATLVGP